MSPREAISTSLGVAFGASIGANLRFWIGYAWPHVEGKMPWSTLGINILGSAVLALVYAWAWSEKGDVAWLPAVGGGLLGGFTTFSTFSVEMFRLGESGRWDLAVGYALTSVLGGFGAAFAAFMIGRRIWGA